MTYIGNQNNSSSKTKQGDMSYLGYIKKDSYLLADGIVDYSSQLSYHKAWKLLLKERKWETSVFKVFHSWIFGFDSNHMVVAGFGYLTYGNNANTTVEYLALIIITWLSQVFDIWHTQIIQMVN